MPIESFLKQSAQPMHLLWFYFGEDSERDQKKKKQEPKNPTTTTTTKRASNFGNSHQNIFTHWGSGNEGVFICFVFLLSGDNGKNNKQYPRRGRKLKTNIKASISSKVVGLAVAT